LISRQITQCTEFFIAPFPKPTKDHTITKHNKDENEGKENDVFKIELK
jgi:hypothetical protein